MVGTKAGILDFMKNSNQLNGCREKSKGSVIFEFLLVGNLLIVVLFTCHVGVVKLWRKKIEKLQEHRLRYDGELRWMGNKSYLIK